MFSPEFHANFSQKVYRHITTLIFEPAAGIGPCVESRVSNTEVGMRRERGAPISGVRRYGRGSQKEWTS